MWTHIYILPVNQYTTPCMELNLPRPDPQWEPGKGNLPSARAQHSLAVRSPSCVPGAPTFSANTPARTKTALGRCYSCAEKAPKWGAASL